MVSLISAGVLSLAAIAAIYRSWCVRAAAFLYGGIALFVSSCVAWSFSQGWEFGLVYALCMPALLVWLFIARNQVWLAAPRNQPAPRPVSISVSQVAANFGHGLMVLVVLMLVSVLVGLALSFRLPTEETGQLAVAIVIIPLVWGLAGYHYLATRHKGRASLIYLAMAAVSLAMLIYLPGLQ